MRTKIATVHLVLIAFLCGAAALAEAENRNLAAAAAPAPTPKAEALDTSYIPGAIFQATPGSLNDWIELRGPLRTASKSKC
jgi:hypothetical protein